MLRLRLVLLMGAGGFYLNHALNNWLPELQRAKGLDAVAAGQWAAMPTLVGLFAAVLIPRIAPPEKRVGILAAVIVAALAGSAQLQWQPRVGLIGGLVLVGLARGAMNALVILLGPPRACTRDRPPRRSVRSTD